MREEELSYTLWQIISKVKKTLFGYRVTVLLSEKDSIKTGDTVYVDTDKERIHSYREDVPAVVYKLAWSCWADAFFETVNDIVPDKTVYYSDWKEKPDSVWARLWLRTKGTVKEGDVVYASPDRID